MEGTVSREELAGLERQVKNLSKLVDINSIVNSTLDIKKLLKVIMEIIKDIMEAEASTLLLFEEDTRELVFKVALGEAGEELTERYRVRMGQGIAGWCAEQRKPIYVNDVYTDNRFDPNFDKHTGFVTRAILCSPLLYKGRLLGVIQAINPVNRPGFDDQDMNLFQIFSEEAALAVQNAMFFQNALEEERIKAELTSARSIQSSLIPDLDRIAGAVSFSARSRSAREVGGDFYGLFTINGNRIGIALGDIHEKGIPGGLRAAVVSGALRSLVALRGSDPAEVMRLMIDFMKSDMKNVKTFSLFYGVMDTVKKELLFSNTGVGYPILLRDGVARYLRMGHGLSDPESCRQVRVRLHENDQFVLITDGLIDVKNRGGQKLGLKRVMDFSQALDLAPRELILSLMEYAEDFSDGLGCREDISVVAFRVS